MRVSRRRSAVAVLAPPAGSPAAQEDADVLVRLYDATAARAYGVVLQVVRDPVEAAAITERLYLDLWDDLSLGRSTADWSTSGVVTLAHGRAVGHARGVGKSVCVRELGTGTCWRGIPTADGPEAAGPVHEGLCKLPAPQRRAIELTYFCGHAIGEVASLLDVPPTTVAEWVLEGLRGLRVSQADSAGAGIPGGAAVASEPTSVE